MSRSEKILARLQEEKAPFKEGDKVSFVDPYDKLETIDTVYDIYKVRGGWQVELESTERVIKGNDIKYLKLYKGK